MADVLQVPSIWDYLAQAGQSGVSAYKDQRAIEDEKRQRALQTAALLFGQGAIDNTSLTAAASAAGMPNLNVQPNAPQVRRGITSKPGGLAAATPEELTAGGLNPLDVQKQTITQQALQNQPITDVQSEVAGIKTPQEREQAKITAMFPILEKVGGQFADQVILDAGGRITPQNVKSLANKAYNEYKKQRASSRLGQLTPEEETYTKQFFQSALMDRLVQQRQQDIQLIAAQNRGAGSQASAEDKLFGRITALVESARREAADLLAKNPVLAMAIDNPALATTPIAKGALARYKVIQDRMDNLQTAQSVLAAGGSHADVSKFLRPADFAGTPAPGAAPGTAAAGSTATAPSPDPVVSEFVTRIKSGQGTLAQARASRAWSKLTVDQRALVEQLAK